MTTELPGIYHYGIRLARTEGDWLDQAAEGHCQVVEPDRAPKQAARLSPPSRCHLNARFLPPHPEGFGASAPVLCCGHQVPPRTEMAVDHGVG
jgi:hypothetical protein